MEELLHLCQGRWEPDGGEDGDDGNNGDDRKDDDEWNEWKNGYVSVKVDGNLRVMMIDTVTVSLFLRRKIKEILLSNGVAMMIDDR